MEIGAIVGGASDGAVDTIGVIAYAENCTVLIGDINPVSLDPSLGCEDTVTFNAVQSSSSIEVTGTVRKFSQFGVGLFGTISVGGVSINDGGLSGSTCTIVIPGTTVEVDIGDIAVDTVAGTTLTVTVQAGADGYPDAYATLGDITQVGTGGASLTFVGAGVDNVNFASATDPVSLSLSQSHPTAVTSFLTSFSSGTGDDTVTFTSLPGALDISVSLGDGDDTLYVTSTEIGSTSTIDTGDGADEVQLFATSLTQADIDLGTGFASIHIADTFDGDLDCTADATCTYSEALPSPNVIGDCSCTPV